MCTARFTALAPLAVEACAIRASVGRRAEVVRTGMGPAPARRVVHRLERRDARPAIVAGLCGGLDPALAPGDVIVARELRHRGTPRVLPCADALAAALAQHGIDARLGALTSVARFARNLHSLRAHLHPDVLAVDMESAWLAALADTRPFAVLRVVVDTPEAPLRARSSWRHGRHALRTLRATGPALVSWAEHGTR